MAAACANKVTFTRPSADASDDVLSLAVKHRPLAAYRRI